MYSNIQPLPSVNCPNPIFLSNKPHIISPDNHHPFFTQAYDYIQS